MRFGTESGKGENKVPEDPGQLLKVAVVGTGRMGACLGRLLRPHCSLAVCGRRPGAARALARRLGARSAGITEGAASSDVVIAAVPTEALLQLVYDVSGLMPKGSLFVDISSVKCGITDAVSEALPKGIGYSSVHPLFASANVGDKDLLFIRVRPNDLEPRLMALLSASGMRVYEMGAGEHDRKMAALQALHHFVYIAMRASLRRLDYDPEKDKYMTHTFRKSMAILRRIESNSGTVEMIQRMNRYAPRAREVFMEEAGRLHRRFKDEAESPDRRKHEKE